MKQKFMGNIIRHYRGIRSALTGYVHRFVRNAMERTGKILLFLFRNCPKTVDFFRTVNSRLTALLSRAPSRRIVMPDGVQEKIVGEIGVNVAGYITSESGVGEAVRANIRSLETAGIPFALNNISSFARQRDDSYADFVKKNPYAINALHVNADQVPVFYREHGEYYFRNKYNIGVWYWELSNFPEEWHDRFQFFHEIWVGSEFCRESIAAASPIPVIKVPPSMALDEIPPADRNRFGLKKDSFVFFFLFSFLSVFERKNPLAVIEAFRLAFRPDENVALFLKSAHSEANPGARARMAAAAQGLNVRMIDENMKKNEIIAMMSLCDCYVSLHRSEGFSIPLVEAMYLKKPAVATAYSGNMDFMNVDNSFLVKFKLVEIEKDLGPYKKGNVWAEPDVQHAAEMMRRVYDHKDDALRAGKRAGQDIKKMYDPAVTSQIMAKRIEDIVKEKGIQGGY